MQLRLEDYTMYFTGTANNDQYGIQLDTADFYVGDGTTNGVVTCNIGAIDESTVYFDVAGQSSTFTGGLGGEMYVEKLAAGTLDFAPAYTSSYFGFDAQQGTVTFLTANATAPRQRPYCRRRFHAEPRQRGELAGGPRRELDRRRNYQRPVKLHGLTILVLRPH